MDDVFVWLKYRRIQGQADLVLDMGMIILVFNVESYDKYLYLLKKRMLFKEINFEGTVTPTLSHSQSSLHLHPLSSHFFSKTKQSLATPSNLTVKNKTVNNIIHKSDIVSW